MSSIAGATQPQRSVIPGSCGGMVVTGVSSSQWACVAAPLGAAVRHAPRRRRGQWSVAGAVRRGARTVGLVRHPLVEHAREALVLGEAPGRAVAGAQADLLLLGDRV